MMSRTYRITSTVAMQVILGCKPMDLKIVEEALIKKIKKNINVTWGDYTYREKNQEQFQESLGTEIEKIRTYMDKKWQTQWASERHGRNTYSFISNVNFAKTNRKWFQLNRFTTYILTGYGPINSTLNKRGLADTNPPCKSAEETVEHILFDCAAYHEMRTNEIASSKNRKTDLIKNELALRELNEYTKNVFGKRNSIIINERESRGSASLWQGRETSDVSDG